MAQSYFYRHFLELFYFIYFQIYAPDGSILRGETRRGRGKGRGGGAGKVSILIFHKKNL
jgi:hypothetical protein